MSGLTIAQAAPEPPFAPVAGTERELPAQLVLLAMGFLHPEQGLLDQLGVEKDRRGNVQAVTPYTTSVEGDLRRGRRAPRPIADRVGDQRGPPVRAHGRPLPRRPRRRGGVRSRDEGIAGHADADEGPEGPPQHVSPGVPAG